MASGLWRHTKRNHWSQIPYNTLKSDWKDCRTPKRSLSVHSELPGRDAATIERFVHRWRRFPIEILALLLLQSTLRRYSNLAKPIHISDLGALETNILKQGLTQVLPFRDRGGRRIVANLTDANVGRRGLCQGMVLCLWFRLQRFSRNTTKRYRQPLTKCKLGKSIRLFSMNEILEVSMAFFNCTKRRYTAANINVHKRLAGRSSDALAYQFIEIKRAKDGTCCFESNGSDDHEWCTL